MGDATIVGSQWKMVHVGRILYIPTNVSHPDAGKIATIVEIVDHKRALVDGPSSDPAKVVLRQVLPLAQALVSPLAIEKLPRGARTGAVKRAWEKAEIDTKWAETSWAKTASKMAKRKVLSDFDRFKLMRLRKQARHAVRTQMAKA